MTDSFDMSEEQLRKLPEASRQCQHCHREILRTWQYCPRCGKITNEHVVSRFTMTGAENTSYILNGLISYHERMTMGNYPERDYYLEALRFALTCVEEKLPTAPT